MQSLPPRIRERMVSPVERSVAEAARRGKMPRWRVRARRLARRLDEIPLCHLVYRTAREMSDDDATHMAAGLAYYAVLSLFPLSIGLISLLGMILESETATTEIVGFLESYLPGSGELLAANAAATWQVRGLLGVISFLGLFWSASLLFGAITRSVNRAWDIHQDRPFYIDKVRHIIMAFSVAPLFLMSIGATTVLHMVGSVQIPLVGEVDLLNHYGINVLTRLVPLVFTVTIFLLIFKFTPNTRTHWRYVFPGALVAGILFEVAKSIFAFYLDNFANYERVYGSLASVVIMLAWTYFSGLILIAGAEFSSELERMDHGVDRGQVVAGQHPPDTTRPPSTD